MEVRADAVLVEGNGPVELDEVFWTTRAAPAAWLADTGLALDAEGFIRVTETLQSVSHPEVFAAGDIASIEGHAPPKSGVYAVRSGPPLAGNLRRMLEGRRLVAYKPQREALYLISTGERYALGARNGFTFEGAWVWKLKDFIDRRFMAKFNELPEMAAAAATPVPAIADQAAIKEISAMAMRCGGCGAKVGATVLTRALGTIEPARRDDVVVGLDAPDDAAVVDTGGKRLSVHTVDYFRAIVDDPYTFGRIAANHALGDIYAMGAEPQTALAIATVPYGIEAKVEADLAQMMAGANEILREAECALVGGHTSEGAELSLGFAVNGLVDRDAALRKGGLRPGDALILTKPIGTGSLLAAHMRGKAKARWVMAAIAPHDAVEPGRGAHPARARRQRRHRHHRLRPARPSGRDGQGGRRRCHALAAARAAARGPPRDHGGGHLLLAAAAERQAAPGDPQPGSGGCPSALSGPVRPADGRRPARVRSPGARAGLRRRLAGGGISRRRRSSASSSRARRRLPASLWSSRRPAARREPRAARQSNRNNKSRRRCPVRTNPFYDAWLFLIGQTSDHSGSGVGSLLVVLFLASSSAASGLPGGTGSMTPLSARARIWRPGSCAS